MPESTDLTNQGVEGDGHEAHGGSHEAHDEGHEAAAGHGPFDIQAAMLHHNMPYPAWEPVHGKPLLIFDLGTYAAINVKHLAHEAAFANADGTPYEGWAKQVVARKDFRYGDGLDAGQVAKAMSVASHHSTFGVLPQSMSWLNQQLFFGLIALILLFLGIGVVFRRKTDQAKPQGRVQHAFEAITLYLRDVVVRPAVHHHPDAWTPFFVSMFLMILAVNLIGLIPGAGTMSGNIGVTISFAAVTLVSMLVFGMKEQGPKFWLSLVPIHFTWAMSPIWLLLLVIELLGLVIKPFALAVRLFANMFAGHTVLLVFMSLGYVIIAQAPESSGLAASLGAAGFLLSVAFHAMEILVAFIQAYVFTMLSAMFIGAAMHPEH